MVDCSHFDRYVNKIKKHYPEVEFSEEDVAAMRRKLETAPSISADAAFLVARVLRK